MNIRDVNNEFQRFIQGDAGGKASILGADSIGHCDKQSSYEEVSDSEWLSTRVGTLIVATNYLQLIQNRYMFRSFTVLQCSHQHCVRPVVSDVEVVGYL